MQMASYYEWSIRHYATKTFLRKIVKFLTTSKSMQNSPSKDRQGRSQGILPNISLNTSVDVIREPKARTSGK